MKSSDKTLKWRMVADALTAELDSGAFRPGDMFYSMKDVCERFEVSDITVRRAFDTLKIAGRIFPNGRRGMLVSAADNSQDGFGGEGTRPVYFCFLAQSGQFDAAHRSGHAPHLYHEILKGFQRSPFSRLFDIKAISTDFLFSHLDRFQDHDVIMNQEILFATADGRWRIDTARLRAVRRHLKPIVFQVFKPLPGMTEVRIDKAVGIQAVIDCLVRVGHSRIGYLGKSPSHPVFRSRFQGYIDALERHGLPFNPAWIGVTEDCDPDADQAFAAGLTALPERPTALVCANDSRALAVLVWCREHGIRVPEDLAVTGFDNIPESALSHPPLTTVDQRLEAMGTAVLDLLRRRHAGMLKEPARITITPEVVERASHSVDT